MQELYVCLARHKLAGILLLGILIRLLLIPISAHPFDVYAWYQISTNIVDKGPFVLENFPPLWYHYMMVPVAYVYNWLSSFLPTGTIVMSSLSPALDFYPSFNIEVVPGFLFNSVVKFPFLISDILVAGLLYRIVFELKNNKRHAEIAAIIWFLNPFVIWISAGWGMWDSISALLSLAAFYFVLKKRFKLSAFSLSLGVACKLYPLLFVIPIIFYIIKNSSAEQKLKDSLSFLGLFLLFTGLLFLPYVGAISNYLTNAFIVSPEAAYSISAQVDSPLGFGLTYWSVYFIFRSWLTSSFFVWVSYFVLFLTSFSVLFSYFKIRGYSVQKTSDLAFTFLLPLSVLFLTYRFICEQFFVWLIPFLIILYMTGRIKPIFYWALSLIALLYSIMNCPVSFFFLPIAPQYSSFLVSMANFTLSSDQLRVIALTFLGTLFSVILIVTVSRANRKEPNSDNSFP